MSNTKNSLPMSKEARLKLDESIGIVRNFELPKKIILPDKLLDTLQPYFTKEHPEKPYSDEEVIKYARENGQELHRSEVGFARFMVSLLED